VIGLSDAAVTRLRSLGRWPAFESGRYSVLEEIGRGGMGTVYLARDEELGREVAIKIPNALASTELERRLAREARVLAALEHPGIVPIHDFGRLADGRLFYVMKRVNGRTLREHLPDVLDEGERLRLFERILEPVAFAHAHGVIHRDLKPSNVMLLQDGTVKVMDFGIARARRFDGLTATGAFLGTPDYLAPEAIEGRGAEPRSDLYALGVIFFELLTGRRPFTADTPYALLKKHCSEEPPRPSQIQAGLPPELEAIVLGLLAKDPSRRPADAEGLVVALRDWLNRAA
jgi:serine/threonine protein kinase